MSFRFKKFEVDDSHSAQKVGTDGVLIGAWTDVDGVRSVLDIGAGCGLVSLMIAQRTDASRPPVTAVEVEAGAAADCRQNFDQSPWANRLNVIESDFACVDGIYDLIVSNPPFFLGDKAASGLSRRLARQGGALNYFTLIDYAARHLSPLGRLAFTSDIRHRQEIEYHAALCRLSLRRLCSISGKEGKAPIRLLWEFSLTAVDQVVDGHLSHRDVDGNYHPDYVALTKDFYLKM